MKTNKLIILCGGQGSRVREILRDLPKILVPYKGKTHLEHILDEFGGESDNLNVFLAAGIGGAAIETFVAQQNLPLQISHETVPLGTGGAILNTMNKYSLNECFVVNGDTIYENFDKEILDFEYSKTTVFLSYRSDPSRFGFVNVDLDKSISFTEKPTTASSGWVNAGIYFVKRDTFRGLKLGDTFSFENDILAKNKDLNFVKTKLGFEDFGVPDDLIRFTDVKKI